MSDSSIHKISAGSGRRSFLAKLASAAIAPAAASVLGAVSEPGRGIFQLETFVSLVGSEFRLAATKTQPALTLTLHKAEPLRCHVPGAVQSFSLRFKAPLEQPLSGQIYELEHPELGSLALFMSPVNLVSLEDGLPRMEAIINQVSARHLPVLSTFPPSF